MLCTALRLSTFYRLKKVPKSSGVYNTHPFLIKNILEKSAFYIRQFTITLLSVFFFISLNVYAFTFYRFIKLVKKVKLAACKNASFTVAQSSETFYKRNLMLYVIVKYHDRTVENDEIKF